jgi:exopolysaccharide production protein ExoQ
MKRLGRFLEYVFALGALFFTTGGLTVLLTPENSPNSPLVQVVGVAIGLLALAGLLLRPLSINRAAILYWPMLLLVAFAAFSMMWSDEPDITLRRAGSLILTTIFALWLVERFRSETAFKLVVTTFIALCAACWFVILFDPHMGIHQETDLVAYAHAGSWRGLYFHKNDFGRAISFGAVTFAVAAIVYRRWTIVFMLLFVQAMVLIANSQSSQAIILSIVPSAAVLGLAWLRDKSVTTRTMIISVTVPLLIIVYMASGIIFSAVLEALGKDETLTGRTEIWMGTIQILAQNSIFGGGFGAGWGPIRDPLKALTGIEVGHAHNGYLDLVADIGVVGLSMILLLTAWMTRKTFATYLAAPRMAIGLFGFAFAIFYIVGNWAGSFLMLHNNIYWVLLTCTFCFMRDLYNPYSGKVMAAPRQTSQPVHWPQEHT